MTSQERYSVHAQLEQMQAKYVGTGHADITKLCDPSPPLPPLLHILPSAPFAVGAHGELVGVASPQ